MDNLDIQILHSLLDDCRESDRSIGTKIGISGAAVNSRISKMIKTGVIEGFTLKIEPSVFGLSLLYVVVTGQDTDKILKQLDLIGEPFLVVPVVGGISVCGIVVKEDVGQKIEILKNIMKDVRLLSVFEAKNPGIISNLTRTDVVIIEKLLKNPRAKFDELAKNTKLSTKTVARSLQKLQNDEAIQYTVVYNPTKFDKYIPFAVLTWITEGLEGVLKILNKEFGASFLMKPFLAKNQIVLFLFSNNIFELDAITQKVRSVVGVGSADLFIPKKITFPQKWIINAIKQAQESEKLHLTYQTPN